MRLLIKWLRPINVPSPKRKNIPFRVRIQCELYSICLKILKKYYTKYAFSDYLTIKGGAHIQICNEFRDSQFEAELKRMHIILSDSMIDVPNRHSSHSGSRGIALFFKCFHFSNSLFIDINGEKITLEHGDGRSFITTMKGYLKESDASNLLLKYSFSGLYKDSISTKTNSIRCQHSIQQDILPKNRRVSEKPNSLFGNDPLLEGEIKQSKSLEGNSSSTVKHLEGVSIDESF